VAPFSLTVNQFDTGFLTSPASIAFGTHGSFSFRQLPGGTFTCDPAIFGDPAVGEQKGCYRGPATYTFAAAENGTFSQSSLMPVAYGAGGHFIFKLLSGTLSCVNNTFASDSNPTGDPAFGMAKACYALTADSLVAYQGQSFSLDTPKTIYYGSGLNGDFVTITASSGTCNNALVGIDPDSDHVKACWVGQ
jgi:hypothetical protein